MRRSLYRSPARPGVGSTMSDIYAWIANAAGNGSNTAGEISTALLNLGLGVEATRNALQVIAGNVGNDPIKIAAINQELLYLNNGAVPLPNATSGKKTLWLILGGLALVYLVTREKN